MTNILAETASLIARDQDAQLFRAAVITNVGNLVTVQRTGQPNPDGQSYAKLDGVTVVAGDEVLVARVGSGYLVLGKIVR